MKKLPKKYAGVLFSFYASAVMVLIVSAVLVALNTGIDAGYPLRLLKSYLITWPVAFASLLGVRPLVVKWGGGFGGGLRQPENMNKAVTTLIASECRLLSASQKRRFS